MPKAGNGWSEPTAGPGGLAATIVATLALPATYYLVVRDSFRLALRDLRRDPRWSQVRSQEDADRLIDEYL